MSPDICLVASADCPTVVSIGDTESTATLESSYLELSARIQQALRFR